MRIVSWNVNGIRSVVNKGFFLPFIDRIQPDILCLQETKAMQGQAEIDLSHYEEYWNSAVRKGYSGTAIFTKTKPLSVSFGFPEDICKKFHLSDSPDNGGDPNAEGRVIAVEFPDFYVVNSYTPNAKRDLSRLDLRHKHWDPAFLAYVKELEKRKPVVFCGDLNVAHTPDDLDDPKGNEGSKGFTREEREGIDTMIAAGYMDTFRHFVKGKGHYTWWAPWGRARDRNIGWRIDYIFVSKSLLPRLQSAEILFDQYGSDHCPVSIELQ